MFKLVISFLGSMLIATTALAGEATGAGSSFFYPIASKWADNYNKETGNKINYQSIGSGAGIKQINSKTVTFGATDAPVKAEDLASKGQVQFPIIVGGIVAVVNLKDVTDITLSVDILAKIYMDKIKNWNDKEIADLNPNVKLPNLPIIKVRRSDGSGTTYNFTKYLADANADWKKDYGIGQAIEWPGTTLGSKGNEGVATNVQQANGSIGYVEYAYAKQNKLTAANMLGVDGKKIIPGIKAFQTNWPMVATTYVIMYTENPDPSATKIAKDFFIYTMANDSEAEALDYVPLNAAQKAEVTKILSTVN